MTSFLIILIIAGVGIPIVFCIYIIIDSFLITKKFFKDIESGSLIITRLIPKKLTINKLAVTARFTDIK